MPAVINAGGSLTGAVILCFIAWGVRKLREAQLKHQQEQQKRKSIALEGPGRFFAEFSLEAVKLLVETTPVPHYLIDVRPSEELRDQKLPKDLAPAIHIPGPQLRTALTRQQEWQQHAGDLPLPSPSHVLVLLAADVQAGRAAAYAAAAAGFPRAATLAGGPLACAAEAAAGGAMPPLPPPPQQQDLNFLSRDATALLLELAAAGGAGLAGQPLLLDVRRADERCLYGALMESVHLPADQLASALELAPEEFARQYHCRQPQLDDVVVLQSRTSRRAAWAAQLLRDAGYSRVYVQRQGVYGWRLDPQVRAYRHYELWQPPPEPEPSVREEVDAAAAERELLAAGLLVAGSSSGVSSGLITLR